MKTRINEWWNVFWKNIFCKVWIESRKLFFADKKITRDNFQHGCKEKSSWNIVYTRVFTNYFCPKVAMSENSWKVVYTRFHEFFLVGKFCGNKFWRKGLGPKKWFKKFQEFCPKTWGHLFLVPFQPVVLPTLLSKTGFV